MARYETCDKALVQHFALCFSAYCRSNGININSVCAEATAQGKGNFYKAKVARWCCGYIDRPVYVYSLNALCEVIGLKLMDFVSVHVPDKKVEVPVHLLRRRVSIEREMRRKGKG